MHMRDGKPELVERCSRRSSSRPVLLRVLVLPFLYSKDPRDQSAEEKSGGIPHLVQRTHTHTKLRLRTTQNKREECVQLLVCLTLKENNLWPFFRLSKMYLALTKIKAVAKYY